MKVDIIGGGVGGLCAGIVLQQRGVQTTIYEAQPRAGGLCTNWRRGKYSFNGCIHWVLGLSAGSSFSDMWRHVFGSEAGNLLDQMECLNFDERVSIEVPNGEADAAEGSTWTFTMLNDPDRFEAYLLSLAPEDKRVIKKWMDAVRMVAHMLPDLPPYPTERSLWGRMWHRIKLCRLWPMLPFMLQWGKRTTASFAKEFKNERLSRAIERLYMEPTGMVVVIMGQAYMAKGVAPYPIGGSEALTAALTLRYAQLGGTLRLASPVERIVAQEVKGRCRATGLVLTDGTTTEADWVCSAVDWRWTMGKALGLEFLSDGQRALVDCPDDMIYPSYCRLHLGVAQDLRHLPHYMRVCCSVDLPDGTHQDQLEIEVNHFDPTLAPEGHTTVTINYVTRNGRWWHERYVGERAAYNEAKARVWDMTREVLRQKLGNQLDLSAVEVVDIATPVTYWRYTGNTLGSSQGWAPQRNMLRRLPTGPTIKGVGNFVMVGHWQEAGGGIPVALISAIRAERIICGG